MKNKELTGIRRMADELGVSIATISRALNPGTSHLVREDRRKRIMEMADKMQYRPNPGARLIQRGVSPVVNMLIPGEEEVFFSEFYARFMAGVVRAAKDSSWEVRINALRRDATEFSVLDEFRRLGLGCSEINYGSPAFGRVDGTVG